MNAIELLDQQHDDVEELFKRFQRAQSKREKESLFLAIADMLAIHSTIEEEHFYPAVRATDTNDIVDASYAEHRQVKILLSELIEMEPDDPDFVPRCEELSQRVLDHVEEERARLFPNVRRILDDDQLEAIAQAMLATMTELLEEGSPRERVVEEIHETQPTA